MAISYDEFWSQQSSTPIFLCLYAHYQPSSHSIPCSCHMVHTRERNALSVPFNREQEQTVVRNSSGRNLVRGLSNGAKVVESWSPSEVPRCRIREHRIIKSFIFLGISEILATCFCSEHFVSNAFLKGCREIIPMILDYCVDSHLHRFPSPYFLSLSRLTFLPLLLLLGPISFLLLSFSPSLFPSIIVFTWISWSYEYAFCNLSEN